MCTVTLVPTAEGFRLACNRDERHDRPAALPPSLHRLRRRSALYPVDPVGGGTWIGVNDRGIAVALLNRTPERPVQRGSRGRLSRGLIVPAILDCASPEGALGRARAIDPDDYGLFRLLILSPGSGWILTSDGVRMASETVDVRSAFLLTSSSLGDHHVCAPRMRLFLRLLEKQPRDVLAAQDRFHDHYCPSYPELSVRMCRADARTVSRTVVTVTDERVQLVYRPLRACSIVSTVRAMAAGC